MASDPAPYLVEISALLMHRKVDFEIAAWRSLRCLKDEIRCHIRLAHQVLPHNLDAMVYFISASGNVGPG
jgi:hypothetical protein